VRAESAQLRAPAGAPLRSRRLLGLAGDERLVEQIRRGDEAAFEVAFERYGPAILTFCRHMLGSREEAEDAVQHTFAAAWRALQRSRSDPVALKPWLFTIARNRCLSMLRARREHPVELVEPSTAGLAEQVEQRAELQQLLADLRELPGDQRAALLLAQASDLSHREIADVLGCEAAHVKALVFRARSALIQRRAARATPCRDVQERLANLRGGSLRRTEIRLHLRECAACRAYREQVKQQRRMLGMALPVAPTLGLKSSVLAAVGIGGGSAGGGAAGGLAALAGAFTGTAGSTTLAKVAAVGVLAGGGALVGDAVVDSRHVPERPPPVRAAAPPEASVAAAASAVAAVDRARASGRRPAGEPGHSGRGGLPDDRGRAAPRGGSPARSGLGPTRGNRGRAVGHGKRDHQGGQGPGRGRGPIEAPPRTTPVRRGPPEPKAPPASAGPKPKSDRGPKASAPSQGNTPAAPVPKGKAKGKSKDG
jgi:RNA polymerase sigma factor (sigma-70 family)